MVMWETATTLTTLLFFNVTVTLATAFIFDVEEENKPQMPGGHTHHIACVQRWRLEATCITGPWLECPTDPNRDIIRAEAKGYTTFPVEGGEIHLKRYNVQRTWDKALKMCRSDGATLVKIDTAEKQDIVRGLFHAKDYINRLNPWIGLRDTTRSNVYRWTDGSNATYTNWRSGEPSPPYINVHEDCVEIIISLFEFGWNNLDCHKLRISVCEM